MSACRWACLGVVCLALAPPVAWPQAEPEGGKDRKAAAAGKRGDIELVERLLAARKEYQLTLETLRVHYIKVGDLRRARWAEDELVQFHRIAKHPFDLKLDVPPPTLKGEQNIPEANRMYRHGMTFKDKGWGTDYIDNQRRAEIVMQRILTEYPQSNKISDVAYQLGDIYESKAFQQYERAAAYFERCYQWNPKTQYDARMRAARLYERQLNDRGKAIGIYKEITTHETDDRRIEEARTRLQELSNRR